jgi:hypothetical protein
MVYRGIKEISNKRRDGGVWTIVVLTSQNSKVIFIISRLNAYVSICNRKISANTIDFAFIKEQIINGVIIACRM